MQEEDEPDREPAAEPEAMSKLQKLLDTERILKQQAVNKLAEIMARKVREEHGMPCLRFWREI